MAVAAGGPAAPALDGLAAGLRDRHDAAAEVAALSAQARLSAIVVGAAPLVSLALSLLVDRRVAPDPDRHGARPRLPADRHRAGRPRRPLDAPDRAVRAVTRLGEAAGP